MRQPPRLKHVVRHQHDRRAKLAVLRSDKLLDPGDAISNSSTGKTAGTVTNAAPNLDDKWEFLAVLQRDAIEAGMSLTSTREQSIQVEQPAADIVAEGLR